MGEGKTSGCDARLLLYVTLEAVVLARISPFGELRGDVPSCGVNNSEKKSINPCSRFGRECKREKEVQVMHTCILLAYRYYLKSCD